MKQEEDEGSANGVFSLENTTRLIALTDGVFAIIMTLLILEVKVPQPDDHTPLDENLKKCAYELSIYFMSFLLAGVYWVSHRILFSNVKQLDNTLVWMNIFFLMFCSVIPFVAALLGNFPQAPMPLIMYGMLLTILAGMRLFLYIYITSQKHLLLKPIPKLRRKRILWVMTFAPIMFILSMSLAEVLPRITLVIYAVTPIIFATLITLVNRMRVTHHHHE